MRDAEVAIAAAQGAAMVVRHRFGADLERVDKGGGDFATSADLEAEAAIRAVLDRERPADAVLGEELGRSGTRDFQRLWLTDPLCGTLNFAARTPLVAVNVALSAGGRFQAAAMVDPFSGETFWTGEHAAHVRLGGRDLPLIPSATSGLVELNLDPPFPNAPGFRAGRFATVDAFWARFRPRVVSTSLALAWVAAGRRAAYITDGDMRDNVHYAAGIAICEAAECAVSDLLGGDWRAGVKGLIVAADAATLAALVELVRQQQRGDHG